MAMPSKKGPHEPKNYNIPLDGKLHRKLQKMAQAHRRSLRQEILTCLENCVARWELESSVRKQATRDRSGQGSSRAPVSSEADCQTPRE